MTTKTKVVTIVIKVIMVSTNISTGYMFYQRKTGILAKEKQIILQLEMTIKQLKKERKQLKQKFEESEARYFELQARKQQINTRYVEVYNRIDRMPVVARDSIFTKYLESISTEDTIREQFTCLYYRKTVFRCFGRLKTKAAVLQTAPTGRINN